MKNVVTWFEIYVEDMSRAQKFYETVIGLPMNDIGGGMVAFPWTDDEPNAAGCLVKSDDRKPNSEGTIVYFESQDCDIELARVEEAGGKILVPKTLAEGFGYFAQFQDTEGNVVGLFTSLS